MEQITRHYTALQTVDDMLDEWYACENHGHMHVNLGGYDSIDFIDIGQSISDVCLPDKDHAKDDQRYQSGLY